MTDSHGDEPPAGHAIEAQYGERTLTSLIDLLQFAEEARDLIAGAGPERFFESRVLQLAAEALVQRVGEAAARTSEQFRADHPAVPWRVIRGMRNVVAHEYHQVDYTILWETIITGLPAVTEDIRDILAR